MSTYDSRDNDDRDVFFLPNKSPMDVVNGPTPSQLKRARICFWVSLCVFALSIAHGGIHYACIELFGAPGWGLLIQFVVCLILTVAGSLASACICLFAMPYFEWAWALFIVELLPITLCFVPCLSIG